MNPEESMSHEEFVRELEYAAGALFDNGIVTHPRYLIIMAEIKKQYSTEGN